VQGGEKCPSNSFPPKHFFCYWVEEGQIKKQKYFLNNYLGGVKKNKKNSVLLEAE